MAVKNVTVSYKVDDFIITGTYSGSINESFELNAIDPDNKTVVENQIMSNLNNKIQKPKTFSQLLLEYEDTDTPRKSKKKGGISPIVKLNKTRRISGKN